VADDAELDVAVSLTLPARADAARRARKFLTDFCRAAGLPAQLCQTAALLVSELVTNAVVHGRTSATIEVHRSSATTTLLSPPSATHPTSPTSTVVAC
jgi:anti-sigma regulatory factor (Ser/Thr protein kinase)